VAIVWPCRLGVEEYAAADRRVAVPRLRCPACQGPLTFWSGYPRFVRRAGKCWRIWVRRGKCRSCGVTHALLPVFLLLRRLDPVAVIGNAVSLMVEGLGARPAAEQAGVPHPPPGTGGGGIELGRRRSRLPPRRGSRSGAGSCRGGPPGWNTPPWRPGSRPGGRRGCERPAREVVGLWRFVSAVSGGSWLSTTTTPPWAGATGRAFIATTPSAAP
jgi:hypothetical protein